MKNKMSSLPNDSLPSHSPLTMDFQIIIASVNGSGTLTANRILHKALFRESYNVVGKSIFPSNIEGLPTYYLLRLSKDSQCLKTNNDLYVGLNPSTYAKDQKDFISKHTQQLINSDLKKITPLEEHSLNLSLITSLSFKNFLKDLDVPFKIKKRLSNMIYVGWIAQFLKLKPETFKNLIFESFKSSQISELNYTLFLKGWESFQKTSLNLCPSLRQPPAPHTLTHSKTKAPQKSLPLPPPSSILIEGHPAAALGWVDGGCQVATWYPITPSTSLMEAFEAYSRSLRPQKSSTAILQSEDEISALCSVIGAGWAGARAATATSGPGLSLMNEAIGLGYFAEIPSVIWNVQRLGPSTGLPTRTSQGDLESTYKSSHGDTRHPLLIPSTPTDCYHMAIQAFEIAEKYQTPVFVLSDLDLGMNPWISPLIEQNLNPIEKKNIYDEIDLEALERQGQSFKRYLGDQDGIPRRTLPGTSHPLSGYLTRGTSHTEEALYSESPQNYVSLMNRLDQKIRSGLKDLPPPRIKNGSDEMGIIYYGSTQQIFPELNHLLSQYGISNVGLCQICALPLHPQVFDFISKYEKVWIIEQNRDAQMKSIVLQEAPQPPQNLFSLLSYDGWPIQADQIFKDLQKQLSQRPHNKSTKKTKQQTWTTSRVIL